MEQIKNSSVAKGAEGAEAPLIGLLTKMLKENMTFLALLRLYFALE